MKDQCIIIIDPQKDFISENGAYAKRHPEISAIKNATQSIQRLIDTKKDFDIIVVYSNYKEGQFGENLVMCIPGTEGHELGIPVSVNIAILSKTQHSAFTDPVFTSYLDECGYKQIFLCGFLAEYCVKQTALDALKKGMDVFLIKDCIATGDDVAERMMDMIAELRQLNVGVIDSSFVS